ncbi:hypothetical protein, partial [Mesorhizobium sp. M7A.F.Ca.MR.148.00.0.0]|uniref:NACHT domain-containing protein n=1 Tax=Mesorhizobium sp. M7A.F.Ca.MR.148.00.0.0 TaxID=2496775 RepID=UPI000FCA9848
MYHYEMLGDERFQEFCQALISASFPNAQCLPVGQPDGGRDAFLIHHLKESRPKHSRPELIVFQVKYVKKTLDSRSEREMVEDVINKEGEKVEKLKSAGLQKYYLITNIKGTSHLDVGSIDRVNGLLSEKLGIEAYCWWRDDLDRRLDGNSSVRWSYPEILKATDLLEALVSGALGEGEERRKAAIRAYMVAQYEDDQELKFKQTDLRSSMTELFIDLPMHPSVGSIDSGISKAPKYFSIRQSSGGIYHNYMSAPQEALPAAEFLLNQNGKGSLQRIVLEGAPGQGKSTITQYMCQVMRMHLLGRADEVNQLQKQYQEAMVRIPFRVDLRDLAKWVSGIDPFQPKALELDEREPRSLEGFLAGQVRFMSGGHDFNVSDLTAVTRVSHLLLALDGFDEVADIELRQRLVLEITKGATRLMNAGGFSVQTIVTSRPAAFAKSVRFPRDQWSYFELLPLERPQVDGYTTKWMKAKGIKSVEQSQLRRILDAKLREAHTQFLAKNPMQLTILLSLIHNRGTSLPEKRTAMYDAYMDMFFSRESEKSDIVRENRELLIDIHRHLAWKLQTSAEGGESGSIERGALRSMLLVYLDSQGESTAIVTDLFNGIVERVGAIVSRVQETYEFEVQPLREYFAARHLYETAPYSPAGDEKSGTKLDRFDALIRNPYWLNVARFYGGCFSKGEISALVDELFALSESEPYKLTSHPRSIALMFLGDWVFTQNQPSVKKIIAFISEYPQLHQLISAIDDVGITFWTSLPERSGRSELLEILWNRMLCTKLLDERRALASAVIRNSTLEERLSRWRASRGVISDRDWFRLGSSLGIFSNVEPSNWNLVDGDLSNDAISILIDNDQLEYLENSDAFDIAKRVVLNDTRRSMYPLGNQKGSHTRLGVMTELLGYYQYLIALRDESAEPVRYALRYRQDVEVAERNRAAHKIAELNDLDRAAIEAYERFLSTSSAITSVSIEPWVDLVGAFRAAWGDCAAIDRIAFVGAGVRSKKMDGIDSFLKGATDLVRAARFARLKSGAPRWWAERLQNRQDGVERKRLLLLLWLWGSLKTIVKISSVVAQVLDELEEGDWVALCRDFSSLEESRRSREDLAGIGDTKLLGIVRGGTRLCMFVGLRVHAQSRLELGLSISRLDTKVTLPELQFAMDAVLGACRESNNWAEFLPHIKSLYLRGASVYNYSHRREELKMPVSVATMISEDVGNFPLTLVSAADSQLKSNAGAAASKLLDIANQE